MDVQQVYHWGPNLCVFLNFRTDARNNEVCSSSENVRETDSLGTSLAGGTTAAQVMLPPQTCLPNRGLHASYRAARASVLAFEKSMRLMRGGIHRGVCTPMYVASSARRELCNGGSARHSVRVARACCSIITVDDVVVVYIVYVTYAHFKLEREAGAALGAVSTEQPEYERTQ